MKLTEFTSSRVYLGLAGALLAMLLIMLIGTVGYRIIGGPQYSWVDCFYMTFITVATIGYGEVVDLSDSPGGRLFTVFIAVLGIGTMTYTLSAVTAFILESDINHAWRRKKMLNKIAKLKDHYIVCGVGRVGSNVVHELAMTGRHCVIIDANQAQIENYIDRHPEQLYLLGDATDNDILLAAGINRARGVFAVASDDSQNLVISLSAKQLNPALRVVARCHDVRNIEKTRRAGADEIVSPDFTGGLRIVSAMVRPHVMSFLDEMIKSEDNLRMEEIRIPQGFSGKSLSNLYSVSHDYIVLAVRQDGKWVFNPTPQHVVHDGDVLMVMASPHGRLRLEQLLQGAAA
ncbi:MAG: potassium channel protein [Nitrosomonadales bacterium]|nr:potassium channel protein [Nitrosomonadales bacterium]